jgi:hypothetical protein
MAPVRAHARPSLPNADTDRMTASNDQPPEEFEFTMQPGPAGQLMQSRRRLLPRGVVTAWAMGAVLLVAATNATAQGLTKVCEPQALTCSIDRAMLVSLGGFGLFAGLLFAVLGSWSWHRADMRDRAAEQDLATLPPLRGPRRS